MNAAQLISRCLSHKAAESPYILGKRVEKVMEMHTKGAWGRCIECDGAWKCDTVRALDGEDL
jgi:hypothetical protein